MKFIKRNIKLFIGIIIGMLLISGISVYASYKYFASDVIYTEEKNVSDALNDLYLNKKQTTDETKEIITNGEQSLDKYYKNLNVNIPNNFIPEILWTNNSPNSEFAGTTINLDLSSYKYVIIITKQSNTSTITRNSSIISKVEATNKYTTNYIRGYGSHYYRPIHVWSSGIEIGDCAYPQSDIIVNARAIPLYIYGIKGELNINIVN